MSAGASAGAREGQADRSVLWAFLGTLASAVVTAPLESNSQHLVAVAIGAFISAVITEGRRGLVVVLGVAALAWFVTCGGGTGLARLVPDYQARLPHFAGPPSSGGTTIPSPTPTVPSQTPDAATRPLAPTSVKCTATCVITLTGTGTSPVPIDDIGFAGAHPGFTLAAADNGCSGKVLEPEQPCTITVSFTADPAGGRRQATLLIHERTLHHALANRITLVGGEATAGPSTSPSAGPTPLDQGGGRGNPTPTTEPPGTPLVIH